MALILPYQSRKYSLPVTTFLLFLKYSLNDPIGGGAGALPPLASTGISLLLSSRFSFCIFFIAFLSNSSFFSFALSIFFCNRLFNFSLSFSPILVFASIFALRDLSLRILSTKPAIFLRDLSPQNLNLKFGEIAITPPL